MDSTGTTVPSPHRSDSVGVADLEQFLLFGATEIQQLLRSIGEHGELVTMYFGGGNDFLLTTVLGVGAESVIFDYGSREDLNQRALASNRLTFLTTRDKIKVQWSSPKLWRVMHQGTPAFCIALPDRLLRLQRREYYRLPAPITKPLKCLLPPSAPGAKRFEFTLADVSLGGIAMHGPITEAGVEIGRSFKDCEIVLPDVGNLVASICVANVYQVTMRNGVVTTRAGCRFIDLRGKMYMLLQRYINRLERERHERVARLDTGD